MILRLLSRLRAVVRQPPTFLGIVRPTEKLPHSLTDPVETATLPDKIVLPSKKKHTNFHILIPSRNRRKDDLLPNAAAVFGLSEQPDPDRGDLGVRPDGPRDRP